MDHPGRRQRGSRLIELLMVVALTALVLSLLFSWNPLSRSAATATVVGHDRRGCNINSWGVMGNGSSIWVDRHCNWLRKCG